ncbi:MAG TPA: transglutaminaseTgpA domain-containing protein [Bryobacteraceae bacterium]|nr:transglutaminaseTgpA domain-containing protein [Bryobacteraceae bacterium]
MTAVTTGAVSPVDRFFQFSLLGLLASGYLAVVGSGYLDMPTMVITAAALVLRGLITAGVLAVEFPPAIVTAATLAYAGFYPIDYFYVSGAFIPSTVHLVFFVAVVKIVTAKTNRDYLLLKVIAFLELLAACVLSYSLNFFVFLLLFLILGVATFTSSEMRDSGFQLQAATRISGRALAIRLAAVALLVSAGILVITSGLFFFLPRTARAAFQHLVSHRYYLAGFSNRVVLGEIGEIKKENSPVMHVHMDRPEDRGLPLKWRGAVLVNFNGRVWTSLQEPGQAIRPDRSGQVQLDDARLRPGAGHISYLVYLNDIASDALFFAGTPEFLRIDSTVIRRAGGNYTLAYGDARNVSYQVYSRLDPSSSEDLTDDYLEPLRGSARREYLQVPPIDPRVGELAQKIVGSEASPIVEARLIEKYLKTNFGYTLELPATEPQDPIADFLFRRKKGHCEYFASTMAVMLRSVDIPSRVVTGFQSGVYNPISGSQLIRTSDAHSWVEAWMPRRGWTTFDPTPPDPNPPRISLWTRLGFYTDAAEVFWQDWVVNYNLDRQLQLASKMGQSSRHVGLNWFDRLGLAGPRWWNEFLDFAKRYGLWLSSIGAMGLLALLFGKDGWRWWNARQRALKVQRGEAEASDATLLYRRMLKVLKRRGVEKPMWLTPCEFARVLEEPEVAVLVEDLTSAYNELRFGGRAEAAGRMVVLLERLEAVP